MGADICKIESKRGIRAQRIARFLLVCWLVLVGGGVTGFSLKSVRAEGELPVPEVSQSRSPSESGPSTFPFIFPERDEGMQSQLTVVFSPGGQGAFVEEGQPSTRNREVLIPLRLGMIANLERSQIPEIQADDGWTFVGWQIVQEAKQQRILSKDWVDAEESKDLLLPWKIAYMGYPDSKRTYRSEELLQLDFTPIGEKQWRLSAVYREAPKTGQNVLNFLHAKEDQAIGKLNPVVATGEVESRGQQFGWFLIGLGAKALWVYRRKRASYQRF